MGTIRIGIGGWSYAPWRGSFYPEGLRHKDELAYAASHVSTIEINATYYGTQQRKSFAHWARAVPEEFVYSVKASRYCTNRRDLAEAGESIARFIDQGIAELGPHLGPILWQLSPGKTFDRAEMAAFIALLPQHAEGLVLRHAIEPRHESFRAPAFAELAAEHGIAIVRADHDEYPLLEEQTASFAYLRLMRSREAEPDGYPAGALDEWAKEARRLAERGDVFLYFIGGAKIRAPSAAQAMLARLG